MVIDCGMRNADCGTSKPESETLNRRMRIPYCEVSSESVFGAPSANSAFRIPQLFSDYVYLGYFDCNAAAAETPRSLCRLKSTTWDQNGSGGVTRLVLHPGVAIAR